jgi:molecular chaperone GrpE
MGCDEDVTGGDAGRLDPELEGDLGPELELRGDVLGSELDAARSEAESWREKCLRASADLDNFRKRTARERADEQRRAAERVVLELLPVIDDLERTIDHTTAGGDLTHLLDGVEAVHAKFVGVLTREGVEIIDPFGKPFDPHKHEAVGQREDAEVPEHTVIEVLRKGYEMGGRVIRHAMVMVSTGGPRE